MAVVDRLERVPGDVILPSFVVTAVCAVPGGAHPSYAHGYGRRDNTFYRTWDGISRDRATFSDWIERHILGAEDHAAFLASLAHG